MNATNSDNWAEANQRYLMAAVTRVRQSLNNHIKRIVAQSAEATVESEPDTRTPEMLLDVQQPAKAMPEPSALDTICSLFALSPFERDVLLLCGGVELDSSFAALCAVAQGDARHTYPTFSLALAALPDAHWSALNPAAPLRRWRLIEVGNGQSFITSPLRIEERILHYLAGVSYLDERLHGLLEPVRENCEMPPSHQALARRITECWMRKEPGAEWPAIQLCGSESTGKRAVAAWACEALGLQLYALRAGDIPVSPAEREALAQLWQREAILSSGVLMMDCDTSDQDDNLRAALNLSERISGPLIIAGRDPLPMRTRTSFRLDVRKPSTTEQRELWREVLGPRAEELNGQLDKVVSQFSLDWATIRAAGADLSSRTFQNQETDAAQSLWESCRAQSRPRLDDLAQRIEPAATWDDLVLPETQRQMIREIAAHVRHRTKVYETWGFAAKGARGLGISALFAGASGTGKTMAAEVLANELQLDLYRVDLSQVVSKYIGETEKNLRRIFDAAEEGSAILLFDEADALFGKRSDVKDSHDRYANIEISYLLQRMESYRGLAILTTNMKTALDQAFLRRIRFVVQFPFPDAVQRAEIWRRIIPTQTPTTGLDVGKLAQLNITGGNIRNIALNAAFLAADACVHVGMPCLLRAAHNEYTKLEKPLTDAEIGGWT